MNRNEQARHDEDVLDDLPVVDAAAVTGAGSIAPPQVAEPGSQVLVGHERDGYRVAAGPVDAEARRNGNQTEYRVRAGDRRVEGEID